MYLTLESKVAARHIRQEQLGRRIEESMQLSGEAAGFIAKLRHEAKLESANQAILDKWDDFIILAYSAGKYIPGATLDKDQTFWTGRWNYLRLHTGKNL